MIITKGIAIGKSRIEKKLLPPSIQRWLLGYWSRLFGRQFTEGDISKWMYPLKAIVWRGHTYQINDSIVIQRDSDIGISRLSMLAWKGIIESFFIHEVDKNMLIFFSAKYYDQIMENDKAILHPASGMSLIKPIPRDQRGDCVRPISQILHKFVPLPAVGSDNWERQGLLVAYEVQGTFVP